jgi:hypothetical protein
MRRLRFGYAILLGSTGLVATIGAGCTPAEGCFADSACGRGKICINGKCVTGTRGGGDSGGIEGDPFLPPPGDPLGASDLGPPGDPTFSMPVVTILSPAPYALVRDVFTIKALVVDPDGISPGQVEAMIAERFYLRLDPGNDADTYQSQFDARQIPYMAFPSLVVTAHDIYGNVGYSGLAFALDREPPIVALDSPDMIAMHPGTTGLWECSEAFNPLGSGHVRHGDVIDAAYLYGRGFYPRARIEDVGNQVLQNIPVVYSGIDDRTTFLYLLDNDGLTAGHKLLLGDGPGAPCNRLDPGMLPDPLLPRTDQAIIQKLVPAGYGSPPRPWGEPIFSPRPLDPLVPPCESNGVVEPCKVDEDIVKCYEERQPLCATTPEAITIWIGAGGSMPTDSSQRVPPAVYVVNDYDTDDLSLTCAGGVFDAFNHTSDGPACITAVATDKFGNAGFAQPIAVCIDLDGSGTECAGFAAAPPDPQVLCTNNCVAPNFGTGIEYFDYYREIYE